jgi:hypothetical protein
VSIAEPIAAEFNSLLVLPARLAPGDATATGTEFNR